MFMIYPYYINQVLTTAAQPPSMHATATAQPLITRVLLSLRGDAS